MGKSIFLCTCMLNFLLINSIIGQPIIDFSWEDHSSLLVGSFAFWSASHVYGKIRKPEILDDFHDVDLNSLWQLDLRSLRKGTRKADHISDATLYMSGLMPIVLSLSHNRRSGGALGLGLLALHGFFIESGITHFTKLLAERPRPHIYLQGKTALNKSISKNSTMSFYSGHTSSAAYFTFFTAQVFSMLYPQSPLRKYIWGISFTLPAITGFLRVKAGKHFPTDVVVGYLVGGALGVLIPKVYTKAKKSGIQIHGTGHGISMVIRH